MKASEAKRRRFRRLRKADDAELPALTILLARDFLARYPDHSPAWIILGRTLTGLGDFDEAERALETALRLVPEKYAYLALAETGHHWRFRGDFARAVEWYERAVEADPDRDSCHIFLGAALAHLGQLEAAEMAHRAAIRCEDDCQDEAYLNLGLVLRVQGRLVEAGECFRRAIELDPAYLDANEALRDVRMAIKWSRKLGADRDDPASG